jgi:hypothetical protein
VSARTRFKGGESRSLSAVPMARMEEDFAMEHAIRCGPGILGCMGAFITVVVIAVSPPAAGQSPDPSKPGSDQSPPVDPKQDPRSTTTTARRGETLSERLDRTGGVIRPPSDLNPDMSVRPPVPHPGTTPVIPPPGSPGGDPRVEPK